QPYSSMTRPTDPSSSIVRTPPARSRASTMRSGHGADGVGLRDDRYLFFLKLRPIFRTAPHRSARVGSNRSFDSPDRSVPETWLHQYQTIPNSRSFRTSTIWSAHCRISAAEGIRLTSGKGATKVWISGRNLVNVPSGAGGASCDLAYMASSMAFARWITS